jgi:AraC-like DNA-binding protein
MAKRPNFPKIRGFEFYPEGKLLGQRVDFETDVGIAYERCIGYTKPEHSHDRITITFPRGSSRSFIKTYPDAKTYKLNQDVVHMMAQDQGHEQGSVSTIYDTFALFVTETYYRKHLEGLGVKKSEIEPFLKITQTLSRSAVLAETVQRYFFLRVLQNEALEKAEMNHLESLILNELFSLARKGNLKKTASHSSTPSDSVQSEETGLLRALEFIESHLFEKLDVEALVASSRTSQATLFRQFKRDLKASPLEYVRNRRMDEARTLLKTGNYQVSDVALLVGYEDLSSFSKAFKVRFRTPPSQALPKASIR